MGGVCSALMSPEESELESEGARRWGPLLLKVLLALAIGYFGFLLRLRAAEVLPLDNDEGGYYLSSLVYRDLYTARSWSGIVHGRFGYEHPPLAKLIYGAAMYAWPTPPYIWQHPDIGPPGPMLADRPFKTARVVAATLGSLQVTILALIHPLAGALLCICTWHVKYTSQVMMEPMACVFSTLCALCYQLSRHAADEATRVRRRRASAVFLGLTAASKYPYSAVGIAILVDWLLRTRDEAPDWRAWLRPMLGWGLLSLLVFFAFNPRLYADPAGRLWESFVYHFHYARSEHVIRTAHPWYIQLYWLSGNVPFHVDDQVDAFLLHYDHIIAALALVGIASLWRRERFYAIWLLGTLAFLCVWNTKWPQYLLMLMVPYAIAASEGIRWPLEAVWRRLRPSPED